MITGRRKCAFSLIFVFLLVLVLAGCEQETLTSFEDNSLTFVSETAVPTVYHSDIMYIGGKDYAFLSSGNNGLQILNVTSPSSPQIVVGYNVNGFTEKTFACYNNNTPYLFIASGSGGINVIDISDVMSAILDTSLIIPGDYIKAVYADTSSGVLYAGGDSKKLYALDITSLPGVHLLSTFNSFSPINDIEVRNNVAYIVQDQGIDIVNVSNPSSPSRLTQGLSEHIAHDISFSGSIAAISNDNNGVLILDVTNPSNPEQRSFITTYSKAVSVAVEGSIVYVAEDGGRIEAFNISSPGHPVYLAYYNTRDRAKSVTQYRGYIFVSDYSDYLVLRYP